MKILSRKRGIALSKIIEGLPPLLVWVPLLMVNNYSEFQVNIFNNNTGFSLTPYLESFTPTFGQGTPVFPRISSDLHCGTPTFSKRCLWDSYFQNASENPDNRDI